MPPPVINIKDTSDDFEWYTVVTKFNYEKKFAKNLLAGLKNVGLEDKIIDVVVPIKETKIEKVSKNGEIKKSIKSEKIYPLYVFVKAKMDESVWNYIRNTTGASTILLCGGDIVTLGNSEINQVKKQCGIAL